MKINDSSDKGNSQTAIIGNDRDYGHCLQAFRRGLIPNYYFNDDTLYYNKM